jgi:hypothetical protein
MDRSVFLLDPRHVGLPSVAPKMISEAMVRPVQTVHLSCLEINVQTDWNDLPIDLRHLGVWNELPLDQCHWEVPSSVPEKFSMPIVHLAPILDLSCTYINTIQMDENEFPLDQCHLEVPSRVPEKISMPVVHSMQTMHLSCAKINTISKRTETCFHLAHVT